MRLDDDLFPLFTVSLGALVVFVALFSPEGEGKTAAIALGSNLAGIGGGAYQAKLKYGEDE